MIVIRIPDPSMLGTRIQAQSMIKFRIQVSYMIVIRIPANIGIRIRTRNTCCNSIVWIQILFPIPPTTLIEIKILLGARVKKKIPGLAAIMIGIRIHQIGIWFRNTGLRIFSVKVGIY